MTTSAIAKALLYKCSGSQEPNEDDPAALKVQFNPVSLSYSVQNTLEKKGKDAKAKQFVAQTTAKLEFDLVFDATHDGVDVRAQTDKVKKLLDPGSKEQNKDQAPPLVGLRWGTFRFRGIVESFKETLDFFSHDGVPLRSTVKLSLSAQDPKDVFTDEAFDTAAAGSMAGNDVQLASVPPGGLQQMAQNAGNRKAARGLGAANGIENLRDPGSAVAAVSGGIELKAAAAFSVGASAGASAGFSAGAGLGAGIGGGASLGIGGGVGLSIGTSAGAVGVPAAQGAFAGLRVKTARAGAALDVSRLTAAPTPAAGSRFELGGRLVAGSSSAQATDVGVNTRIKFD